MLQPRPISNILGVWAANFSGYAKLAVHRLVGWAVTLSDVGLTLGEEVELTFKHVPVTAAVVARRVPRVPRSARAFCASRARVRSSFMSTGASSNYRGVPRIGRVVVERRVLLRA